MKPVRAVGWVLLAVSLAAAGLLLALDAFPVMQTWSMVLAGAATFIPWVWLPLIGACVGFLMVAKRFSRFVALGLLAAVGAYWGVRGYAALTPAAASTGHDFNVVMLNTLYGHADIDQLRAWIDDDTQVVVLLEYTAEMEAKIEASGFLDEFPHRVGSVREDAGGTMLFGRTPLTELEHHAGPFDSYVIGVDVDGEQWRVAGIHSAGPHLGVRQWAEDGEAIRALAERHLDGRLVMVGDFNAIEQHHTLRILEDLPITNAMAGGGWEPTWPALRGWLMFGRLDHAYVADEGIDAGRPEYFPISGSDHMGLRIGLTGTGP